MDGLKERAQHLCQPYYFWNTLAVLSWIGLRLVVPGASRARKSQGSRQRPPWRRDRRAAAAAAQGSSRRLRRRAGIVAPPPPPRRDRGRFGDKAVREEGRGDAVATSWIVRG